MKKYLLIILLLLVSCERQPTQGQKLLDQAYHLRDTGHYDQALTLYRQATQIDSVSQKALLEIALTYDEYLGDIESSVLAYQEYLKNATDDKMKARVSEWVKQVHLSTKVNPSISSNIAIKTADTAWDDNTKIRLLKASLEERFQTKLQNANQQLLEAQEKIIILERENKIYASDQSLSKETFLLRRLASNENLIAELQTKIEKEKSFSSDIHKGQELLQSLITNLQHELELQTKSVLEIDSLKDSNAKLVIYTKDSDDKIKLIKNARNELALQVKLLQAPFMTNARATFTNSYAIINQKLKLHNNERNNYITSMEQMRTLIEEREQQLKYLQKKISLINTQTIDQVTINYYMKALQVASENKKKSDKLLYERTRQFRKLQQSYSSLQQYYLNNSKTAKVAPKNKQHNNIHSINHMIYRVQAGDSLMKIARKLYNDEKKWRMIYELNKFQLSDKGQLRIGQNLKVPSQ